MLVLDHHSLCSKSEVNEALGVLAAIEGPKTVAAFKERQLPVHLALPG